jgi:hypothetical protein
MLLNTFVVHECSSRSSEEVTIRLVVVLAYQEVGEEISHKKVWSLVLFFVKRC